MTRITVTALAKQDVRAILVDLSARAGKNVATRYALHFKEAYKSLLQFPASGSTRTALGSHTRILVVHPYAIFYDLIDQDVLILRVLHTSRNIQAKLLQEATRFN